MTINTIETKCMVADREKGSSIGVGVEIIFDEDYVTSLGTASTTGSLLTRYMDVDMSIKASLRFFRVKCCGPNLVGN